MTFYDNTFEREFTSSTLELEKSFLEKDHLKAISYLRFLTNSYCNINYKMADDRLEEITQQISNDLLGETIIESSKSDVVAFYDGYGYIDRVLSRIYMDAFVKLGYQVIRIVHINAPDLQEIKEFCVEKKVRLRIIPKSPILERMKHLQQIIKETAPRHLFFQGGPWDVCGVGVFSTVKGDVTRYFIDAADHLFWLGKCAADYFIGFRGWSYNVEKQLRNIPPEKTMVLPYYPNKRTQYPYAGMPFDTEKYEYVFSGGTPYKIEGSNTYQEIVEYILMNYPQLKFVYAGTEPKRKATNSVLEYLEKTYPGQFFHVDNRDDLDEVLWRAKLYLGTFPIAGGLMTQYAVKNKCIPLCLSQAKNSIMDAATMLLHPEKANFVFYEKEELLAELDRLLSDCTYYETVKNSDLSGQLISEEEFAEELQRAMTEHTTKFEYMKKEFPLELDEFLETYRNRATYEMFCEMIYKSHNDWVKQKYPEIMAEMDAKEEKQEQ